MINEAHTGRLCKSLNGRDRGRYFIIVGEGEDGYVFLADGNYRKLAKPKKKKIKHIKLYEEEFAVIGEKLTLKKAVFDSEIYSALKKYNVAEKK